MGSCELEAPGQRLRGGYLNSFTYRDGKVQKRYTGTDASARRDREHLTLTWLGNHLKVPRATHGGDPVTVLLEFADGTNGQVLIRQGRAEPVLRACGEALRSLQAVEPAVLRGVVPGDGPTIVHGDFGLQNMLLDESAVTVTAILDWEFCHLGGRIEDLAWGSGSSDAITGTRSARFPRSSRAMAARRLGSSASARWPARFIRCARSRSPTGARRTFGCGTSGSMTY